MQTCLCNIQNIGRHASANTLYSMVPPGEVVHRCLHQPCFVVDWIDVADITVKKREEKRKALQEKKTILLFEPCFC